MQLKIRNALDFITLEKYASKNQVSILVSKDGLS